METKKCIKCLNVLCLDSFYKKHNNKYYNICKMCMSKNYKEYRLKNIIYLRERNKRYRSLHREMVNRQHQRYRELNREKDRARRKLRDAIISCKIKKATECEFCGSNEIIEGHHEDYLKPFEVIWLCKYCHLKLHNKNYVKSNTG